jgi:serine/threonine-protein kinase
MSKLGPKRKELHAGDRLDDRYELLYPYAQGGMATVWLARVKGKHGFEKLYAVKTILPHMAADTAFRNMFLDEARIASRIRHTNVADIEDLGEDGGTLYMVLEWVQGDSWSKLIGAIIERGDPIPADLMIHIAACTCAGLHAAHELADDHGRSLNVVHRDVSPQNVMISEAGVVKVIDFGVAKAVGRASEQTRTGLIKGKLEYLAPELAFGKNVDGRADVWAVGATLYQTFAGRPPYTGKNDLDILRRISSGKPPAPLPPTVPKQLADVIMQSLQPDVALRVANAHEFQRLLQSVMAYPISSEDVARALRHYLKPRIEARHKSIADALREAAARAAPQGTAPAPVPQDLLPMRPSFPTLPPEAAPVRSRSIVLLPEHSTAFANAPTMAAESIAGAATADTASAGSLRPLHIAWVAIATLITLGVWGTVVAVAIQSQLDSGLPRSPRATPSGTLGTGGTNGQL